MINLKKIYKQFFLKFIFFFSFFLLSSCQKTEVLDDIVFDNNSFAKFNIAAKTKMINVDYESSFSNTFIDHSLSNPPAKRIETWLNDNITTFGSENSLVINITNASIKKNEISTNTNKTFTEKTEYYYEINISLDFKLFNDSNKIISYTEVFTKRSTTSGKFISLSQKERIIDMLILDALRDISSKSNELLTKNMLNYIL